jgi:uncharacterized protein
MKKILFILLSFFLCIGLCNAEITTYDRNRLENYGVNKHWKIDQYNKAEILNTHAVDANQKVYDFSDILTPEEELYFRTLSNNFYKKTGFELVILTESFYNLDDDDNGDYAQNFYDYNDFGLTDKYYSGVVILRNTYPGMPWYGVYSFGEAQYYYNSDYSDSRLNFSLDKIYNNMINSNYKLAFDTLINDLVHYYEQGKEPGMDDYILNNDGVLVYKPSLAPFIIGAAVIALVTTLIFIGSNKRKHKLIIKERMAHEYLDRKSIIYTRKSDILYNSRTTSYTTSYSSGGSSSGGGRSYSSSRGSSGGGRSGGGRRG